MFSVATAHVHRWASRPEAADVNAYLVETDNAVVAVDSTLTVTESRALRSKLEALGKPLAGVLVTHAHPDHYGGLVELVADDDVPIIATAAVDEVIRRDDPLKETILRPMFDDEWPRERTFPNRTVGDGETVRFDDVEFTVVDLGPGESPADSMWLLGDGREVFAGDLAYNHKHAYLADGFWSQWLENIGRLERQLAPETTLYIGHGEPASPELLGWQRAYIESFVDAVQTADWSEPEHAKATVVGKVKEYLPGDELAFLMELSVLPMAVNLLVHDEGAT